MPIRTLLHTLFVTLLLAPVSFGAELKVGHSSCDITPPKPIALDGQMHTRISKKVTTPITANILALEGEMAGKPSQVIIVSLDLVSTRRILVEAIRESVKKALPDFNTENLVLCATHTHTSAVVQDDKYHIPEGTDCMKPSEFIVFAAEKLGPAIAETWKRRQPAIFSYGLGHAVVAYNRRAVYENGTGVMYGKTDQPTFRRMEGMEDHDIGVMFFWDKNNDKKLLAMAVNISCPAQEVEGLSEVHADFWHPTRETIRAKYGKDVTVVGMIGAAGDMSPHTQYRKAAEERMRKLRNISRIEEMARRIVRAVDECYEVAQNDKKADVPLRHEYSVLKLPEHKLTAAEYEAAKERAESLRKQAEKNPTSSRYYLWAKNAVDRYERQQKESSVFDIPIHVLRIGDVAVLTNPFELFTAYGVQMKARCKAVQTMVVELTEAAVTGTAGYLPTVEAYQHGGYSAIPQSVHIGPEGGQILVEETLKRANGMFE